MEMNKKEFIDVLSKELNYSIEQCLIINDILESNFFISKKNKDAIINELISKLEVNNEEAEHIYEAAIKIINDQIKNKLRHPFKNK